MKISYVIVPTLAVFKATANPMGGSDVGIYGPLHSKVDQLAPAPDPPPAPTPLPSSQDGVLPDGNVINYTPNSCWTPPHSRPPPSAAYIGGICTVCVLQRNGTDGSADYLLWARDNLNNAMGNMAQTTVWPLDGIRSDTQTIAENMPTIAMGGHPLQLHAMLSSENPDYSVVYLLWATPPRDPNNSSTWLDPATPQAMFDPAAPAATLSSTCAFAGSASNSAVVYATCFFDC